MRLIHNPNRFQSFQIDGGACRTFDGHHHACGADSRRPRVVSDHLTPPISTSQVAATSVTPSLSQSKGSSRRLIAPSPNALFAFSFHSGWYATPSLISCASEPRGDGATYVHRCIAGFSWPPLDGTLSQEACVNMGPRIKVLFPLSEI